MPFATYIGRQGLEPASKCVLLARLGHRRRLELHELGRALEVAARQGVTDRLRPIAVALVPPARSSVEFAKQARLLVEQASSQDIREEVVVAIPMAAVIERNDEQVLSIECLQRVLATVVTRYGVADGPVESAQDRSLEQKPSDLVGLALEHLADEIVDDETVITREGSNEPRDILPTLH